MNEPDAGLLGNVPEWYVRNLIRSGCRERLRCPLFRHLESLFRGAIFENQEEESANDDDPDDGEERPAKRLSDDRIIVMRQFFRRSVLCGVGRGLGLFLRV